MRKLKELFHDSIDLWGLQSQIIMFVEEAGEALVAATHILRRNRDRAASLSEFAEEIVDMRFMAEEMEYYFKDVSVTLSAKQIEKFGFDKTKGYSMTFEQALIYFRSRKEGRLNKLLDEESGPTKGGA